MREWWPRIHPCKLSVLLLTGLLFQASCDSDSPTGGSPPPEGSGNTENTGNFPFPGGAAPPEMIEACVGFSDGDDCSAEVFGQTISGECASDGTELVCIPTDFGGPGGGGFGPGSGGFRPGGGGGFPMITDGADTEPEGELASEFSIVNGPRAVEDMTIDDEGYLWGAQDGVIFRTLFEGTPEIVVPDAGGTGRALITGILILPNGDIIYADTDTNTIYRANVSGGKEAILSDMSRPNGLELDQNGMVYVAETGGNRVRRVDIDTGEFTIMTEEIEQPDGVTLSPDFDVLYISSASTGIVYALEIGADGEPGELTAFKSNLGQQLNDMVVDVNGYVYLVKAIDGELWRYSPDGEEETLLLKVDDLLASVEWGSGVGGWDATTLYMSDRSNDDFVYAVNVGVEGK